MSWIRVSIGVAVVLMSACSGQPSTSQVASSLPSAPHGGTLRLGVIADEPPFSVLAKTAPDDVGDPQSALDPQLNDWPDTWELIRCCLARPLLSYEGKPTDEGGTTLHPDLAQSLPDVSADGLTWTFRLRPGMHYSPPLQAVEITSNDFIRSLLRLLPLLDAPHRPDIEGVSDYLSGKATSISGLEAPDRYTLRVRLTRPEGDLPIQFAEPDTLPIPPLPNDPSAPLGVATGHDKDYGRFLVSSGPYMVDGADRIDFTAAPAAQAAAAGFTPGKSLTLVRNPSWDPETDPLRPALVDRIEITIGGTRDDLAAQVDSGAIDFVYYFGVPPAAPIAQVERYQANAALGSVYANPRDSVRAVALNMALPPFDDLYVRKAVNLVVDKARLIELTGGPWTGENAGHIVINSLEDNLLLAYDPYRTSGSAGDLAAAEAEMKLSAYDTNGDGICDAAVCSGLSAIVLKPLAAVGDAVKSDLAKLGIQAQIEALDGGVAFPRFFDPAGRTAFMVGWGYRKDSFSASIFFTGNFDSRTSISATTTNGTLMGATADELQKWGYARRDMPNIDDRIDLCRAATGGAQAECWAELDQYLMENVVPLVPYSFDRLTMTVSPRVVRYSFDQSTAMPALDQIAVAP